MPTSEPLVIAIDSFTTSTKAIVVDPSGRVLATGKREIALDSPAASFYEHNPLDWWTSSNEAIGEAVSQLSPPDKDRITALGITHQRESFAPFDEAGNPLRPGILWLDGRAADQIKRYGSDEIHALSGKPADVTPAIYKLAWVKEHEPDVLPKAHKVMDVHGYLVWNLTGKWLSSKACADSLGLFDIARLDYADQLLEIAGVRRDQMADLVEPGQPIGDVKPEIMQAWGLKGTIPVIAGLGDGQAAGVGAAAVEPDTVYLNLGTAVVAGVLSPEYQYGREYRTLAAGLPGQYVLEVLQNSGAYLATWFRTAFGNPEFQGRPDPQLEAGATAVSPGCGGLITMPYWNAVQSPLWDPTARGAVVGWRGSHGRDAMYRSVLESIGIEMRRNLEGLQRATGTTLKTVRAMGGGTRSPLWRQIMTDATGLPITACTEDEISALGAAVLAMAHTGVHGGNDIATSAREMAKFGDVTEPNMELYELYGEVARIQGQIYDVLKPINDQIHEFAERHPNRADIVVVDE